MVDDEERVPAGVGIAAAVLGLMALVGLLIVACSAFALFMTNTALIPRIPTVRLVVGIMDGLTLALVVLAASTVLDLFRMKQWARYSMIVLGSMDFIFFAVLMAGVLVGRVKSGMAAMPIPGHPALTLGDIMLVLAAFYAVMALIGLWWVVYFNLRPVRLAFADAEMRLTR